MLNLCLEKQNDERLIFKKEIPVRTALTSPFESTQDIVLSGDFSSIVKGKVELRSHYQSETFPENEELRRAIKENRIENASKDLKRFPDNPFLLNNLGLAYLGNKELRKAFELLKRATEVKPDFTPAALNLASLHVAKKEYDSAMSIYENLLKKNPDDTRVLINIGNIYFREKKFEEARDVYKKIIKIDPNNVASRNRLALLNLIDRKFEKAIAELRKCLQINNELPAIYNNLGVAYSSLGAYKKALQSFKTALKIFPHYVSATHNLAVALKQKDISASIKLLEDYLERKENSQIRELLARFYFENKRPQKALKNLLGLLSLAKQVGANEQEVARLHNNIGVVYHSLRDFKNAEENYFACVKKIGYIDHIILGNIIDLYFDLHKINNAKKYIDILRDKFGEKEFYLYYLARYSYDNDKLPDSISFMKEFLIANAKFSPAYVFLNHIYTENLQDYNKAIDLNEKAFRNLPADQVTINNLAYSYLMNNEVGKAEHILKKVEHIINDVFLNATRGLLNIKKGNVEEGRRLYNWAAQIASTATLRNQVIQKEHLELANWRNIIYRVMKEVRLEMI